MPPLDLVGYFMIFVTALASIIGLAGFFGHLQEYYGGWASLKKGVQYFFYAEVAFTGFSALTACFLLLAGKSLFAPL